MLRLPRRVGGRVVARHGLGTHAKNHQRRALSALVLADHDGAKVTPGTLAAVTAARKMATPVHVLVCADSAAAVDTIATATATIEGVAKVETFEGRPKAASVAALCASAGHSHVVAPSSNASKDFAPRVAAALGTSPVTDIVEVLDASTFVRPMYAGNALATVKTTADATKVVTVRATAFDKSQSTAEACEVAAVALEVDPKAPVVLSTSSSSSDDRPDLATAKSVVSGGRGMRAGEHFALLEALAAKLPHGAVGASRAAVDAGMVPNELQVGQTGKVVAPDLYVAVGISGAIQHLSGMKESKVIVAINKDAEAPIFQVADYGLVADLFDAVPEMTQKL